MRISSGGTAAAERPAARRSRTLAERVGALDRSNLGPFLGTTVLPFLLVLYVGLKGGGYDAVIRSEIGIAVWWIVLLGVAAGLLPLRRVGAVAWIGVGAFALFAAWIGLATTWSESAERSVAELARVLSYLGVLALAVSVQGRGGLRRTIGAVGAAVAVIGGLALLSRFHPSWFPDNATAEFLPATQSRLNYPLNYWNGLSALMAIGVPLLLTISIQARQVAARALAAAAIPALALVMFYTLSRGGALALAVALVVFVVLWPRRLASIPYLAVTGAGAALLIAAATQRDALENGLTGPAAVSQGDEMIAICLVVCAGVGLLVAALALAHRHRLLPRVRVSPQATTVAFGAALAVAVAIAVALGGPGELSDRWESFKEPRSEQSGSVASADRFATFNSTGRYQFWDAALDANASAPAIGIGPGTFEYWWAQNGERSGFVRDAHGLYFELLAEVGVIGTLLLVAFLLTVIGFALRQIVRTGQVEERMAVVGALAAIVAFVTAAGVDWAWELAVLPIVFLLLAAAVLRSPSADSSSTASRRSKRSKGSGRRDSGRRRGLGIGLRVGAVALSAFALLAIAVPLASTKAVRDSQQAAAAGQLEPALEDARDARELQPYAATPALQEALVLEEGGQLAAAADAARAATEKEPTNWRTWLTLSRIEAELGRAAPSVAAYEEARSLNPRSELFNE